MGARESTTEPTALVKVAAGCLSSEKRRQWTWRYEAYGFCCMWLIRQCLIRHERRWREISHLRQPTA